MEIKDFSCRLKLIFKDNKSKIVWLNTDKEDIVEAVNEIIKDRLKFQLFFTDKNLPSAVFVDMMEVREIEVI